MEEVLMKLVITVPAAAAVIVTVVVFLKAQREHQKDHNATIMTVTERANRCHEDCSEAVKENRAAVADQTVMLAKVATLLQARIDQTSREKA